MNKSEACKVAKEACDDVGEPMGIFDFCNIKQGFKVFCIPDTFPSLASPEMIGRFRGAYYPKK